MGPATEPLWGITLGQVSQRAADAFGDDESLVSCHQNIKKTFTQTNQEVFQSVSDIFSVQIS